LETFPERFNATASLFETRLITDDEGSAHHLVPTMQGEVYCGFAGHDPSAPLPMVEESTKFLERWRSNPWSRRTLARYMGMRFRDMSSTIRTLQNGRGHESLRCSSARLPPTQ
jgi:hypothetical protein